MAQFFIKILILCVSSPCLSFADINVDLIRAIKDGNLTQVQSLVAEGANVNARDNINATPLHWAAHEGHVSVAEFLIEEGANIEARSGGGFTPLHTVAFGGHVSVAEFLIEKGAYLEARSNNGDTPLHLVARNGNAYIHVVDVLIENGADINAFNWNGVTPLHWATLEDNASAVAEFLIEKGANLNMKDVKNGNTPLHLATYNASIHVVDLLIEGGVDINVVNGYGFTPFHIAKFLFSIEGHVPEAELLIENHLGWCEYKYERQKKWQHSSSFGCFDGQ